MRSLPQEHKDLGVVYTPEELVRYLCSTTIHNYILDKLYEKLGTTYSLQSSTLDIGNLEPKVQQTVLKILDNITLIDPAVGLGFFLISSFKILEDIHKMLIRSGTQKKSWGYSPFLSE